MTDMINHPPHYTQAAITIEPIDVLRYAPFDLGNCLKYIIRAGHKGDALEDLKKANFYLKVAYDTYDRHPGRYMKFFRKYGHILDKFERLKGIADGGVVGKFDFLKRVIDDEHSLREMAKSRAMGLYVYDQRSMGEKK